MNNTTIQNIKTRLKSLKNDLDISQDISKLQREQNKAKEAIAELTKRIDNLAAVEEFDVVSVAQEIADLKALDTTVQDKLFLIEEALTAALTDHNDTYVEYTGLKNAMDALTDSDLDYQKMVNDIKTPPQDE